MWSHVFRPPYRPRGVEEGFKFAGQSEYERLAGAVIDYVQDLLRKKMRLRELLLPLEPKAGDKTRKNNIFVSGKWENTKEG